MGPTSLIDGKLVLRTPKIVRFFFVHRALRSIRVVRVACGSSHNLALTGMWRCGCPSSSLHHVQHLPVSLCSQLLPSGSYRCRHLLARLFSALLSCPCLICRFRFPPFQCADACEVFSWGEGEDGRLGHGAQTSETEPRVVLQLLPHVITEIAAGGAHSAAVSGASPCLFEGTSRPR